MKKEIKIKSTVYPSDGQLQWHPIITAVTNAARRRTFDHFDEELLNRILDIKQNK